MTVQPPGEQFERQDGLPMVAPRKASNIGVWIFAAVCLLGGYMVFAALNERREDRALAGIASDRSASETLIASPPPLQLAPELVRPDEAVAQRPILLRRVGTPPPRPTVAARPVSVAPIERAVPTAPPQRPIDPVRTAPPGAPAPEIVYDAARENRTASREYSDSRLVEEGRVKATRFARPAYTVPRGTVIPAVLETAIDSTRPGAVRALVQRDVKGFDGSRVLIQRGSRLYGEYGGELAQGEKRALVRWTRLIRPDGVVVNLDSPASDTLGRAGIEGDVDTHFWTRFGNALLGTALDVGSTLATGAISGGVVLLPNGQQMVQPQQSQGPRPTLRVDHGTSVSVFVAQDLDFSDVDS